MKAVVEGVPPSSGAFSRSFDQDPWLRQNLQSCVLARSRPMLLLGSGNRMESVTECHCRDLPLRSVFLPPDKAPMGNVPVGVRPFS